MLLIVKYGGSVLYSYRVPTGCDEIYMHPFQESDPARDKKVLNARFSFNDFDSTPEKFKLVVFTLKTYHMFSVHTSLEKFENGTSIDDFKLVFEENSCG